MLVVVNRYFFCFLFFMIKWSETHCFRSQSVNKLYLPNHIWFIQGTVFGMHIHWNCIDHFLFSASAFAEIHEMYRKELEVKHCIKENICHAADRTTIMFYSAAWIHQPYIDNVQADLLLESMLRETEHKTWNRMFGLKLGNANSIKIECFRRRTSSAEAMIPSLLPCLCTQHKKYYVNRMSG